MGVAVVEKQKRRVPGAEKKTITQVAFDNSYQAGGEPLPAAQLGLEKVSSALCQVIHGSEAEGSPTAWYEPGTSKVHLIGTKTGKEVAGAVDCSKVVVEVVAYGH